MGAHAKLMQPSGAKKWLNCPMSSVQEQHIVETMENVPADEGTVAHFLSELVLKEDVDISRFKDTKAEVSPSGEVFIIEDGIDRLFPDRKAHIITPDMIWHVNNYVADIREYAGGEHIRLDIERRMKLKPVTSEDAGGTADAVMSHIAGCQVHDLKYGYINVYPRENPQLMIYALAAAFEDGHIVPTPTGGTKVRDIDVRLVIHQPKDFRVSEWETTLSYLVEWHADVVVPASRRVLMANSMLVNGHTELLGDMYNPGAHCQYCKFNTRCIKFNDHIAQTAKKVADGIGFQMGDVSVQDLVDFHKLAPTLKTLSGKVEGELMALAQDGYEIPGFKLALGRAGNRAWIDETESRLAQELENAGVPEDRVFKTLLSTPTDIAKLVKDKLLTKDQWETIEEDLVTRSDPKPKLVPVENDSLEFTPTDPLEGFADVS